MAFRSAWPEIKIPELSLGDLVLTTSAKPLDSPALVDAVGVIEAVAKRRGFLVKGGTPDLEKASLALLTDYRTGALGRISLETPETRRAMLSGQPSEGKKEQESDVTS